MLWRPISWHCIINGTNSFKEVGWTWGFNFFFNLCGHFFVGCPLCIYLFFNWCFFIFYYYYWLTHSIGRSPERLRGQWKKSACVWGFVRSNSLWNLLGVFLAQSHHFLKKYFPAQNYFLAINVVKTITSFLCVAFALFIFFFARSELFSCLQFSPIKLFHPIIPIKLLNSRFENGRRF